MDFNNWYKLRENNSRYSVQVNYRTSKKDILNGFATGYHVKRIFEQDPLRVLI